MDGWTARTTYEQVRVRLIYAFFLVFSFYYSFASHANYISRYYVKLKMVTLYDNSFLVYFINQNDLRDGFNRISCTTYSLSSYIEGKIHGLNCYYIYYACICSLQTTFLLFIYRNVSFSLALYQYSVNYCWTNVFSIRRT